MEQEYICAAASVAEVFEKQYEIQEKTLALIL